MKITSRGTVYGGAAGSARQSSICPSVCVTENGSWLCSFGTAPLKAQAVREVLIMRSRDEGLSWSAPVAPFASRKAGDNSGDFRAAYLTALGGRRVLATLFWVDQNRPELPFFNEETEGLLDSRIFFSISEDEGETWTAPRWMETDPFTMPVPLTGPTLVLPNGDWACQFELNKPYYDTSPWRHCSVLMFSPDEGRSWPEHVRVSDDPNLRTFYWDQRPAAFADGRILDVFWTFDRETATYLNIHARESHDYGRTWSAMWDCGIPGQPAPPVAMPDGRIALAYMDRTGPPKLVLRVSIDGGRTWPVESEVVLHEPKLPSQTWDKCTMQDAWAEMGQFSVGLPAATSTQDGDMLVVYYAGPNTDCTGIEWILISRGKRNL